MADLDALHAIPAFPSSLFTDLIESDTTKLVVQDVEGDVDHAVTETHRITATVGRVRRPNSGAIRKTRWREVSENRQRENNARNERNRLERLQETEEESAARRLRARLAARRSRQRRKKFIQTQGEAPTEDYTPTTSENNTKVYKRTHNVDLLTRHYIVHSVHDMPSTGTANGQVYSVQRSGQMVTVTPDILDLTQQNS